MFVTVSAVNPGQLRDGWPGFTAETVTNIEHWLESFES